jgi:NAD(P)-dependent dehydrogenase (short-subunit alcohol dehydrogenase family)
MCGRAKGTSRAPPRRFATRPAPILLTFAGDLDRRTPSATSSPPQSALRLDILVNNSGGPPLARAHNATEEQWATAVQRSLLFFARMCREACPLKRPGRAHHQYPGEHRLAIPGAVGDADGVVAFKTWPTRSGATAFS